jgi:hypothetical protein
MQKLSFKGWFIKKLTQDERLREHHFDVLRVYFKSIGLQDMETPDRFEAGLKAYFGE